MSERLTRVRDVAGGALGALLIGVLGVAVIAPETAQAAGVVVERHPAYGAAGQSARERDENG